MCALAVYVMHSSQPKIQDLVSRDSLVDRQFVTNSAQLEGTLYHSPKLHLAPCSSVGMQRGQTDRHTDAHFDLATAHAKCKQNESFTTHAQNGRV